MVYQSIKTGARVAQLVMSLNLTTHTRLSQIFTSNMCIHIIKSNRVSKLLLNYVFVSTFAAFNKRHTTFAKLWFEKNALILSWFRANKSLLSFFKSCVPYILIPNLKYLVWPDMRSNPCTLGTHWLFHHQCDYIHIKS